jgi:hypothetical protein
MKKLLILIASMLMLFVLPNIAFSQEEEEEHAQERPNPEERGMKPGLRSPLGTRMNTPDPTNPVISPGGRMQTIDPAGPTGR